MNKDRILRRASLGTSGSISMEYKETFWDLLMVNGIWLEMSFKGVMEGFLIRLGRDGKGWSSREMFEGSMGGIWMIFDFETNC